MPPVFDHSRKNIAQLRLALRFAMPFRKHRRRHFNILTQPFRRMSAQKQPVKKRRFLLRIFQIRGRNRRNELDARRHGESAVYRKSFPRQVVLHPTRRVPINPPAPQPASGSVGFSLRSYDHNPKSRLNSQSAHPTLRLVRLPVCPEQHRLRYANLTALRCAKLKQGYMP